MKCRGCGCTDDIPCVDEVTEETCEWAEPDLCTFCLDHIEDMAAAEGLTFDAERGLYL